MRYVELIDPSEYTDRNRRAWDYVCRKRYERGMRENSRNSILSMIGAIITGIAMAYILFG